jgi:tetratricopeptide (TPR) repeat protein
MTPEPSRYVQPDASEARVERLWSNVERELEARASRSLRWPWLVGAAFAMAAFALAFLDLHQAPLTSSLPAAEAKLETLGEARALKLSDGSKLKLARRSRVMVEQNQLTGVALRLVHGELKCDVTHRPARPFTVVAGDVEVRVVGTEFSVESTLESAGTRVDVKVLRGLVEIRSGREPGTVARVAAGQSWTQLPWALSTQASPAAPPAAPDQPNEPVATSSATPPGAALPTGPSARELFDRAGERRRAGDALGAARAYEELLKLHPSDGRASLSAFELGRLRMDRLGDSAGAIAALERAVALNVGPSFREDALARLVSVYAAQGNFPACGRARDRYLQSYPRGVHVAAVSSRCGTR